MHAEEAVFDTAIAPAADGDETRDLARLADSLVEHLAETRRHYEQLSAELEGIEPAPPRAVPDEPDEAPAEERVRVFALNLALSGVSRDVVRSELRDRFGIHDSEDILAAVFPEPVPEGQTRRRFRRRRGA